MTRLVVNLPMPTKPKFKSEALEAIHSNMSGMFRAGTVDEATMRYFDETCLTVPTAFASADIKQLRDTPHNSGPV